MVDTANYPVQGKLRIRAENYERDSAFIRERVGTLSNAQLKSMPGFEFLKFWYVDFAATQEQWAALAPELDKRNILVTLYEAPVFYMEALAEEKEKARQLKAASNLTWIYNGLAVLLVIAAIALLVYSVIDAPSCVGIGVLAFIIVVVGQIHAAIRGSREAKTDHENTKTRRDTNS